MAPTYKLYYFDSPGRAELTRMLFHQAGVAFEDYRFPRESWPALKEKMPFGQVPVLEVDGKMLGQSHAIARYVAREHGLVGNDAWDAALCDQYVDAILDLFQPYATWKYYGKTDAEKEEAKKKLFDTLLPVFCQKMTEALKKNPDGWLVCNKVTWADIYLAFIASVLETSEPGSMDKYPDIVAFQKKVYALPNISAYLEKKGTA